MHFKRAATELSIPTLYANLCTFRLHCAAKSKMNMILTKNEMNILCKSSTKLFSIHTLGFPFELCWCKFEYANG